MVSKTFCLAVALAIMASSAQASMQVENFIIFADDPTADNFKLMVFYQLWAFLVPLAAGPIHVFLYYLYYHASESITVGSPTGDITLTATVGMLLGFSGFGNYDQLFETFVGMAPKVMIQQFISFGLLGEAAF